jgi:hypothetical protein
VSADPTILQPSLLDTPNHTTPLTHELEADEYGEPEALCSTHLTRLRLQQTHQLVTHHRGLPSDLHGQHIHSAHTSTARSALNSTPHCAARFLLAAPLYSNSHQEFLEGRGIHPWARSA